MNLFSDEIRRNPYPSYEQMRAQSPVFHVPPPFDGWMVLDYDGVKRVLGDHRTFSSRVPGPPNWFIFTDPPAHSNLRALISQAFTPRMIADLEPRLRELTRELLDAVSERGQMDMALDFSVPLAMRAIASIIGIPATDWVQYRRWSDAVLALSATRFGGEAAEQAIRDFHTVTAEMSAYLAVLIEQRRSHPQNDLLTRLIEAEVDGERLFHEEILGFFQFLVVAGQETTSDLINNSVLCLLENPDQLGRLRADLTLLPSAIEEVLRYRSPTQWFTRIARRAVELQGVEIPRGALVVPVVAAANRDPRQFAEPNRFDIARHPNPHIAFGHGIHFCLGAALSRLEARVALSELLGRFRSMEMTGEKEWQPREPLQVHGPSSLAVRFEVR
jgi:cytochrome P450